MTTTVKTGGQSCTGKTVIFVFTIFVIFSAATNVVLKDVYKHSSRQLGKTLGMESRFLTPTEKETENALNVQRLFPRKCRNKSAVRWEFKASF